MNLTVVLTRQAKFCNVILLTLPFYLTACVTPKVPATVSADAKVAVPNAYPELPEIDFERTSVPLDKVVDYLKQSKYDDRIKIACYVIFKLESASGTMGINNNYIGYQADGGRVHEEWTKYFVGTVIRIEAMTGKTRRFLAFSKWEDCVQILLMRIAERGLYVGGNASWYAKMEIKTDEDWPVAYYKDWVKGKSNAQIPERDKNSYFNVYKEGRDIFK